MSEGLSKYGCNAASRYETLATHRQHYLDRARECSALTIPALIPRDGFNSTSYLPTPYQSVGSRGVTSLASKLVLALFPPNAPFFRIYIPEEKLLSALGNRQVSPELLTELDTALSKGEQKIMWEFESLALRSKVNEAVEHLVTGGNVLLFFPPKKMPQVYHLDQYAVVRSPSGEILEIVVCEMVAWGALPQAVREKLRATKPEESPEKKDFKLFTRICRDTVDDDFKHYQEVEGLVVPGSEGVYRKSRPLPWLPLRWRTVDGESYGRAFVEELLGDLASLESLVKSTVICAAIASKVLFLVKPNSTTRIKTLVDAPSGAVREGNAEDVTVVQSQKAQDLQIAVNLATTIEERLNQGFLMAQTVTRNAERVTATEIQLLAQELEDTLGGVYTLLSQELQRPVVTILIESMRAQGKLALPVKDLEIHILTGLEALGRGADLRKLDTFVSGMAELFGPEVLATYLNTGAYLSRRAAALAIDTNGLIRSEQEVQAQRQQAQQAQQAQQLAPEMLKAGPQMQKNLSDAEAQGQVRQGSSQALVDQMAQQFSNVTQP